MKKITLLAMSFAMALTVKAQNGVEVTDLLTNPDFENQTEGWTIVGGNKIAGTAEQYGYHAINFIENWVGAPSTLTDQDWSQTIEVPNGVYVVKSLAHAIMQSDADVVPEGVFIYANQDEVPVKTTHTNPPAEYSVATIVTNGRLKIGYRIASCNVNWAAWDYVRVYQYLGETEEQAKFLWVQDELAELAVTAEGLLVNHMQASLAESISEKVAAIAGIADFAEGDALRAELKALFAEAEASIEAYEHFANAIAVAQAEGEKDYSEGYDEFQEAVEAAEAMLEEAALNVAEIEAAIVELNDAVFTFQMLNADGTIAFDVTEKFMTNPTLRKGSQGWEGSKPGLEHEVMEFYESDFDMYQTLTGIPNGMYVVRVQGFYRTTWNDSGAAYQDGSEAISVQLYANNVSAPLLSIYKYPASVMGLTNDQVLNDYVNMRVAVNEAFNLINPETEMPYYAENALTVIVQDGTLKIGLRNSGHQAGSWCAFRDFKLDYYGNFPAVALTLSVETAEAWLEERAETLPTSAYGELSDAIADASDYTEIGAYEDDEVMAVISQFDAIFASVKNVVSLVDQLKSMLAKADELITREYPGLEALTAAYEVASDLVEDGVELELAEGQSTEAYYQEAVAAFQAAINAYYESQVASKETPADYTHLVPNANFEQKGEWTWSVVGGGSDQWNGGCRPTEEGGANRQGVNLWGWGITSIDVHQELTGLPNGLYKVSADFITQTGYATDQHVYAKGIVATTSDYLVEEGWDSYVWSTLQTNDYAVVLDGKLTIGAASTRGGSNSEGWFQATNFMLYYCGEASAEDLKAAWDASLARANEYAEVLLAGDAKEVKAAIAAATPLAEEGKYTEACQALNPVVAASDSIFTVTLKFYEGNYAQLAEISTEAAANGCEFVGQVVAAAIQFADAELVAEDATYAILTALDEKLAGYAEYAAYLLEAETTMATTKAFKEADVTFVKENAIAPQVADLVAKFRTKADCEDLLAKLKKAMNALNGTLNLNLKEGDVTSLIVNPTIDDSNATGWTAVKGTGNGPTNAGEHYDGTTSNRYIDSWAPNGLNFTAYQEILGLPDGTYELTVATRTDGDNAYVFAAPQPLEADTAAWTAAAQWAMFKNYGAYKGEIWYADSLAWAASEGTIEAPYYNARNGEGFGWSYDTVTVEVTQHYLAIGVTCNHYLTGKAEFNGAWIGADDWKLTLVKKAETQSEFNPFTGVENIEAVAPVMVGTYDLFGRRVETPTVSGIYIVNGKKVVIKK